MIHPIQIATEKKTAGFSDAKALWYQLGFIGSIFGCEISESWGSSRSTLDFKDNTFKSQSNLWWLGRVDCKLCEAIVSLPFSRWWNDPTSRGRGRVFGHGLQICTQIHLLYSISISHSETKKRRVAPFLNHTSEAPYIFLAVWGTCYGGFPVTARDQKKTDDSSTGVWE